MSPPDVDQTPFWRALAEHPSDVAFVADPEGRLLFLNRAGQRLTGWAGEHADGRTLTDLVAPESLAAARSHVRAACEGESAAAYQLDLRAGDGKPVPFEVTTVPVASATLPAALSIARDVSSRGRADDALRHSEQRFRLLVENAADGLMLVSAQGRIFFASRPAMRWLGFAPEDIVGRDLIEFVDPADRDRLSWALVEAVDLPAIAVQAEYRWRHPDGSRRLHEATLVNHLDHPSLNAIVINFRDVTDRRAAETALHETEQLFRAVFESAFMGIARVDLEGRVLDVNRAVIEMAGYSHGEIVGRPIVAFVHPDET
jgi:PAS domain S-box-containing protein